MSKPIGVAVLEALGLPGEKCVSLRLSFLPNDVVRAEAEYLPSNDAMGEVVRLLREYRVANNG